MTFQELIEKYKFTEHERTFDIAFDGGSTVIVLWEEDRRDGNQWVLQLSSGYEETVDVCERGNDAEHFEKVLITLIALLEISWKRV